MGSLITLLAVADILGNNTAVVATYSKRLVLTALMGEPWGFMGSKRLLWEMYDESDTTTGLNLDVIEQVCPTASCPPMLLHLWMLIPATLFLHYVTRISCRGLPANVVPASLILHYGTRITCMITPIRLYLHCYTCITLPACCYTR